MKIRIAVITLLLACCSALLVGNAEVDIQKDPVRDYIDAVRIELADGKVGLISGVMKLSDEEAEIFWPLYYEYELELFEIGDRRVELIERFIFAHQAKVLDDLEAREMAAEWLKQGTDRLGLLKKYHELIANELSQLHAIQFLQIEHRVNTVIDLMIASELPLFRYGEAFDSSYVDNSSPIEPQVGDSDLPKSNSLTIPIITSWQGDFPVAALEKLPAGQQEAATGYIADARTFSKVWQAFKPDLTVPQVDFENDLVVFARNVNFYNLTKIAQVQVRNVIEVLAMQTMSAAPIEDKVAMSLAVIPCEGVEAIRVGDRCLSISKP
jgi:hypothetical protein